MIYPEALDCGMTPKEFWDCTVMEIADRMDSYRRRKTQEAREKISLDFNLAKIISAYVWADTEHKPPLPWDLYPKLFEKEKEAYEKQKEQEDWETFKERRRQGIAEFNRRRQGGGET